MSDFLNSEMGWLNVVNVTLGLAVLVCVFMVGRAVLRELRERNAVRRSERDKEKPRALNLESLGITLPDGGKSINETSRPPKDNSESDDPPNVTRSEN